MTNPLTVAAVDLGSNSFHMVIGRFVDLELQIIDRVREPVTLADGLDEHDRLTEQAQVRALACLERMAQRLRSVSSIRVRAVGTNTLRRVRDGGEFRRRACVALGHPIEIVSGQEEARLIFLGVAHDRFSERRRLLADIGGGSTEIMLGAGYELLRSHSLFMGCVNYTKRYFPKGEIKKDAFRKAEIAARLELQTIERELGEIGWDEAAGSSGTILTVQEVLRANDWEDGPITPAGLKRLRRELLDAGSVDQLKLAGLKSERARVLPGGVAILRAVFRSFDLESMTTSTGALREGVLHDLVGRIRHDDIRDTTIAGMVERYHVDLTQAERVERTALQLLDQLDTKWELGPEQIRKLLIWASRLHEIGLAVAHSGFHKHGAYLIEHSHLPGFSGDDQAMLSAIVRGHRRKLSASLFHTEAAALLCVLFRLAVLLNRSRVRQATPRISVSKDWTSIVLRFPAGWSETHPLTHEDLDQEARYLEALEIDLKVNEEAADAPAKIARTGGE